MPRCSSSSRCRWLLLALLCGCTGSAGPAVTERVRSEKPTEKGAPPLPLAHQAGSCSLLGNFREFNDHALAVQQLPEGTVFILADGLGGEKAGITASKRAVDLLPRRLQMNFPKAQGRDEISQAMRRAIVETNADLITLAAKDEALLNMGTTVVWAVWPPGNELYVNGVGDCRAYLVRSSKIEQVTVDHSLARALVEAKTITPEEARSHRFRNVLWKYLGSKEVGEGTEVRVLPLQPGDRILLTTKGLTGVVPDDQLLRCVGQHTDLQKCADALGQLALDAGSRDNVSCIVIEGPTAP